MMEKAENGNSSVAAATSAGPPLQMPPAQPPLNAIRADAMSGRRAALVGHSLDPKTGFPRLFNLFTTFPWDLRRHSTFLALHFGMLGLFGLLLLGYTLLALWPLADFVKADNYKQQFRVVSDNGEDFCDGVVSNDTGENLKWKDKEYLTTDWGGNLILKTSLGNFCGPHPYSNSLDCGDTCTLAAADMETLKDAGRFDKTEICQKTYPCSTPCGDSDEDKKGLTHDDDTIENRHEDAFFPCCTFGPIKISPTATEEEKEQQKCEPKFTQSQDGENATQVDLKKKFRDKTQVHVILWCVPGMLLFVAWISLLQYLQHAMAEAANRQNINVSQYAVMISNVGGVNIEDDRLKDFGRYYGDVVAAFHVRNYGRYLTKNLERQTASGLLRELERVKQECDDLNVPGITIQRRFSSWPASWFFWMYKRWLCWHLSVDDTIKALEARDEKLSAEIMSLSKMPDETTGNAIIVFNWVHSAANMLYDHNLRNRLANMFVPPAVGLASNIASGGAFARTPKIALTEGEGSQRTTTHRYVSVSRAPEPNDLWWESTRYGGWPIIQRRILAWIMYFALLAVAFGVQVVLAQLSATENTKNRTEILQQLRRDASPVENENGLLRNLDFDSLNSLKWTIAKTVLTLIFSALGILLIHYISDFSLFLKHTRNEGSTITKIALFQLINSFFVPVVSFAFTGRDSFRLWYTQGGLVELAFLIQVANAFAGSIAFLFRVDDVFFVHFLSRMACSKLYASEYLHPPAFRMNLRLGQAVTTVGLSILYAPILPLSPLIGLIGTIFQYAVDQYIALRHSSKPRAFQVEALTGTNYILRLLPLAQLILIWGLYFNFDRGVNEEDLKNNEKDRKTFEPTEHLAEIFGIVIWGVACIVPLMNRVRQFEYKRWVEGGRPRLLDWAKSPGQKQATWTNHAQVTSALNVIPDVPKGFRFNYDTYLPDVPSLDSEIFTQHIKPHFIYHSPPLPKTRFVSQPGATVGTIGKFEYQQVVPKGEFTTALAAATAVDVPKALSNTCNFRATELAESPEIPASKKGAVGSSKVFTPKVFMPDSVPNGGPPDAAAAPQTFVPARDLAAARVQGKPVQPSQAPGLGQQKPSRSKEHQPRGGVFMPEKPDPLNKTVVFVPDDSVLAEPNIPQPPAHQPGQQGREIEKKPSARGAFGWGSQLGSQ